MQSASDRGASAVEYGLLIAAVAAVIAVSVFAFGGTVRDVLFDDTCQKISEKVTADCDG